MSYTLKINAEQAAVLIAALDMYARVGTGQFETVLDHPDVRTALIKGTRTFGEFREPLVEMKRQIYGLPGNAFYSIGSVEINDRNRVAYDMFQVIRHLTSWDQLSPEELAAALHRRPFGVNYDLPDQTSSQPLPSFSIDDVAEIT